MAFDYTTWPTVADVTALMQSVGLTVPSSLSSDLIQLHIDSASNLMVHRTGTQFLPDATDVVRYFDGSGTGMLNIDPYVSITSIVLYTLPAYSTVNLLNWVAVERVPFAKTKLQILQGQPNMLYGWFTYWPIGRSNVQITGKFGYGANIPVAVWDAVLSLAAADCADGLMIASNKGALKSVKDLAVDYTWMEKTISDVAGWRAKFDTVAKQFRRPLRDHLAKTRPGLI